MMLTTHALTGAVIGKSLDSPWFIVSLALVFHFVLDSLPHGEYIYSSKGPLPPNNILRRITVDLFFVLFFTFLFIYTKNLNIPKINNVLLGVFFSLFPDFLTLISMKFKLKFLEKIHTFHHWVHYTSRVLLKNNYGSLTNAKNDILVSIIAIIILFV